MEIKQKIGKLWIIDACFKLSSEAYAVLFLSMKALWWVSLISFSAIPTKQY